MGTHRNLFTRRDPPIEQSQTPHPVVWTPQPGQIRKAVPADLLYVESLRKKLGHALGFLPLEAIEKSIEYGYVKLCCENADSAGYILSRPHLAWQPKLRSITHAAVQMDAQRRHHGLAMLKEIEAEAVADGLLAIQACCAVGLDSNDFWRAAGFIPIAHLTPDTKAAREIICWRKPLTRNLPIWFAMLPQKSGHRARATVTGAQAEQTRRDIHRTAAQEEGTEQFISTDAQRAIDQIRNVILENSLTPGKQSGIIQP